MSDSIQSKGCSAVVILVVLGVLLLLAVPALLLFRFSMHKSTSMREAHAQAVQTRASMSDEGDSREIHLKEGFRPRNLAEIGDELSRERFVEFAIDSNATTLSREAFMKNANGRKVRWLVRVNDIESVDAGNRIEGHFELPYKIHSEHGYSGSSVSISAEFSVSEKDALARFARNDWVTIEGQLEITGTHSAVLHEAKVVE